MENQKILLVDDEEKMRQVIRIFLEKEGYLVEEACNGKDALEKFEDSEYSLLMLDVMMPQVDGWTVCRKVRDTSNVPVIMLTARGEEYDKLFGFELGVDDYITKPFSPKEVVARVKAVLKRSKGNNTRIQENELLKIGESVKINLPSQQIFIEDSEISLTPKEFDLIRFLAQNPERVYTREQLLDNVWGYDFYGDLRTVDTHIKQLREKLGCYKNCIHTVWGKGYKLKVVD